MDPDFADDPNMSDVDEITLSYTFFRTGEHEAEVENASSEDLELQEFARQKGMDLSGATSGAPEVIRGGQPKLHAKELPAEVRLPGSEGGDDEEDSGKKISSWTEQMAKKIGVEGQLRK